MADTDGGGWNMPLSERFEAYVLDSAVTGKKIFSWAEDEIHNCGYVNVDFKDITKITEECANAFIWPLIEKYGITAVEEKVRLHNMAYEVQETLQLSALGAFHFQPRAVREWTFPPEKPKEEPVAESTEAELPVLTETAVVPEKKPGFFQRLADSLN